MEVHPILDASINPTDTKPGIWYALSSDCCQLSGRVGHVAVYDRQSQSVFLIGGAEMESVLGEVWRWDINSQNFVQKIAKGFRGRYEHCSFYSDINPSAVFVFGGATTDNNLCDIQKYNIVDDTWEDVAIQGEIPPSRTYHVSMSSGSRSKFLVYSGGDKGTTPVCDQRVHEFDICTNRWTVRRTEGNPPTPRQGHVVIYMEDQVYIHGGLSPEGFCGDLYTLLPSNRWCEIKPFGTSPSPRAGHSGVIVESQLFIFGGMSTRGVLDDLWKFDTKTTQWSKVDIYGSSPAPRVDFAMCVINLPQVWTCSEHCDRDLNNTEKKLSEKFHDLNLVENFTDEIVTTKVRAKEGELDVLPNSHMTRVRFLFLHGGMDAEGYMHTDAFVIRV